MRTFHFEIFRPVRKTERNLKARGNVMETKKRKGGNKNNAKWTRTT